MLVLIVPFSPRKQYLESLTKQRNAPSIFGIS